MRKKNFCYTTNTALTHPTDTSATSQLSQTERCSALLLLLMLAGSKQSDMRDTNAELFNNADNRLNMSPQGITITLPVQTVASKLLTILEIALILNIL